MSGSAGSRLSFSEYQVLAGRTEKRLLRGERIEHAILGIMSEGGELADAFKKWKIYSKELDLENVKEELGDMFWYMAIIANTLEFDLGDVASANIAKLQARYPEQYSDALASARLDKQP